MCRLCMSHILIVPMFHQTVVSIMETFFTFVCMELSNDTEINFLSSVYRPPKGDLSDFLCLR